MGQLLNRRLATQKSSVVDCEAWPQLCSKDNVHVFIESVQGCLDAQKKSRKREVQSCETIGSLVYNIHRKIGSGEYSEVFEASRVVANRRAESFAIKVYRSRNLARQKNMREEIKVLQKLGGGCKEIVGLHQYKENMDSETGTLEIKMVMDLCQGGTLRQLLKSIPFLDEQKTKIIMFQLVQALHHLHTRRIIHCDVKPENILFVNKGSLAIKLADFGSAKMSPNGFTPPRSTSFTMSDIYVAPEILQESAYGTPADLWSLGITLYQCLTNRLPFETGTTLTMSVIDEICSGSFIRKALSRESAFDNISLNALLFLEKLLRVDPNERMNVIEALNHKWLKTMDVEIPEGLTMREPARVSSRSQLPDTRQFHPHLMRDSHFQAKQRFLASQTLDQTLAQYNSSVIPECPPVYRSKKKFLDPSVRVSSNYSTTASSPSLEMLRGTTDGVTQSRAVQAFNSSFQELQGRDEANDDPPSLSLSSAAPQHVTRKKHMSMNNSKNCSTCEQFQVASSSEQGLQYCSDHLEDSLFNIDHRPNPLSTSSLSPHLAYRPSFRVPSPTASAIHAAPRQQNALYPRNYQQIDRHKSTNLQHPMNSSSQYSEERTINQNSDDDNNQSVYAMNIGSGHYSYDKDDPVQSRLSYNDHPIRDIHAGPNNSFLDRRFLSVAEESRETHIFE